MKNDKLYTRCAICDGRIDFSVPRELCPFCNTLPVEKFSGYLPLAAGAAYFVHVSGFGIPHDLGALAPKDLPHEHMDIEQSAGNSTAVSSGAWGQFASIANVTTTASTSGIQGAVVPPIFSEWIRKP